MPLRAWFDELHRTLHLGAIGRNYSELAASWLWVISLGGLVLWSLHGGHREAASVARAGPRPTIGGARCPGTARSGVWIVVALLGCRSPGSPGRVTAGSR